MARFVLFFLSYDAANEIVIQTVEMNTKTKYKHLIPKKKKKTIYVK